MALLPFPDSPFQIQLSFDNVLDKLKSESLNLDKDVSAKAISLLEEAKAYPELVEGITENSPIIENTDFISRLLQDYFSPALTLNEIKAINIPYSSVFFNHTKRFKNILNEAGEHFNLSIGDAGIHELYVLNCCLILNAHFGTKLDFTKPLFYHIPANGVIRHYRILYNADFMEILPTDRSVLLSSEEIATLLNNYSNLELWRKKIPPQSWLMKGFAIMSLIDVTVENAVSLFKEKLLESNAIKFQDAIESIFQSIFKIRDIRIGFSVFHDEAGTLSLENFGHHPHSFLVNNTVPKKVTEIFCDEQNEILIRKQEYFSVSDTKSLSYKCDLLNVIFLNQDMRSFILAPVVKYGRLLGVLEVASHRPYELNSINANKLDIVMSFLSDTVARMKAEFHIKMEASIQENYTAIHSSVSWKFEDEARKFITEQQQDKTYALQEIIFDDVYPLYGQVDIKGSTEIRNKALRNDLTQQLGRLVKIFKHIDAKEKMSKVFRDYEARVGKWIEEMIVSPAKGNEQSILEYLDGWIHPQLQKLSKRKYAFIIDDYWRDTDRHKGKFHIERRKYEASVVQINTMLADILDKSQVEAQKIFPHYFERFKTDGVDHNLYIGQSINLKINFNLTDLYALRLWQLKVTCEMMNAEKQIQSSLPFSIDVASLILVYNSPISVRFRMDEKKFDVDGSYNIGFEIIKKRIDKSNIKGTKERITKAGMITIVYFVNSAEREYKNYFQSLIDMQIIEPDYEKFAVEDLQGVTGLKAMRIKVVSR